MIPQLFLMFWLFAAALWDMFTHKIPNLWILTGVLWGCVNACLPDSWGLGLYFVRMIFTILILSPLFVLRMMGAGDLKLISVISGFLGIRNGTFILATALFLAAPFCLLQLLHRRNLRQRLRYFFVYFRQLYQTKQKTSYFQPQRDGYGDTIPFAVFLLAGTVLFRLLAGE